MTLPCSDKIGYTDDGFVFIANHQGMGTLTIEQAIEVAQILRSGEQEHQLYADEIMKAVEKAKSIREKEP